MQNARQLEEFARDIRQYGHPIVDDQKVKEAERRIASRTQDTRPFLNRNASSTDVTPQTKAGSAGATLKIKPGKVETSLHRNAFFLLGATVHDDSRRILELADERGLVLESSVCAKARADLTIPRNRLGAELAWLPGVPPERVSELIENLRSDITSVLRYGHEKDSWVANANLVAAALEAFDSTFEIENWCTWIGYLSTCTEKIEAMEVLNILNEDRAVAGFATIKSVDPVESELAERRRYYAGVINNILNDLPPAKLVAVLSLVVERATLKGERQASLLIDDVVDGYQTKAEAVIQAGADGIKRLIAAARKTGPLGAQAIKPLIDALEDALGRWNRLARPLQLSLKARGLDHDASRELAMSVRSLGVDLFNEHNLLDVSVRLVKLVSDMFAALPEVKEQIDEDVKALRGIVSDRQEAKKNKDKWAEEISYGAEVGLVFKDTLRISPAGIRWNDTVYPLDSITRVRWGGVSQSINGIPTGTTFTIGFGTSSAETRVELRREIVFAQFTNRLWKAVCTRLIVEYLEALKNGKQIRFGDSVIDDAGIQLVKHKFFGNEQLRVSWPNTRVWSADGSLNIRAEQDTKAYTSLSFINVWNTHVLEAILRIRSEKGMNRLSGLMG
jgi:hypothetical protein